MVTILEGEKAAEDMPTLTRPVFWLWLVLCNHWGKWRERNTNLSFAMPCECIIILNEKVFCFLTALKRKPATPAE